MQSWLGMVYSSMVASRHGWELAPFCSAPATAQDPSSPACAPQHRGERDVGHAAAAAEAEAQQAWGQRREAEQAAVPQGRAVGDLKRGETTQAPGKRGAGALAQPARAAAEMKRLQAGQGSQGGQALVADLRLPGPAGARREGRACMGGPNGIRHVCPEGEPQGPSNLIRINLRYCPRKTSPATLSPLDARPAQAQIELLQQAHACDRLQPSVSHTGVPRQRLRHEGGGEGGR